MPGLVDPDPAAPGQGHVDHQPEALVIDLAARYVVRRHPGAEALDVVAHEEEDVVVVGLRRVDRHLRGGQTEDEPSLADVDEGQLENVAQECAVRLRRGTEDDRMGTSDYLDFLPFDEI